MVQPTDTPHSNDPLTINRLSQELHACGIQPGQTILVHTSLRSLGWIVGGAQAYLQALLQAVGSSGTLMMPTQSWKNLDPARGVHPKVPEAWWPMIRAHWPAYDPARTPSNTMGAAAELFRTWPGVRRSDHPVRSLAAFGPNAERLVSNHRLEEPFDEDSPVGQLYALDGSILLE